MSDQKALTLVDVKKMTVDAVGDEVAVMLTQGELVISKNYSPVNALKSAWLILQEVEASYKDAKNTTVKTPALSYCTQNSVKLALMDMVVQGLSPSKKQCYFIAYGKKLQMFRSYFGSIALLKRTTDVKDVYAQVIREADVFEFETNKGVQRVLTHTQTLESLDSKIVGAYATFIRKDDVAESMIMTIAQIQNSWKKSKTVTYSTATHKEFEEEMCKRTVLNKGSKLYLNTSDDSDLLLDSVNREFDADEESPLLLEDANTIEIDADGFGEIEDLEELESESEELEEVAVVDNQPVDLGDLE